MSGNNNKTFLIVKAFHKVSRKFFGSKALFINSIWQGIMIKCGAGVLIIIVATIYLWAMLAV
jgi:hypothetical protein